MTSGNGGEDGLHHCPGYPGLTGLAAGVTDPASGESPNLLTPARSQGTFLRGVAPGSLRPRVLSAG
jgi:hypothetical protein